MQICPCNVCAHACFVNISALSRVVEHLIVMSRSHIYFPSSFTICIISCAC